MISVPVLDNLGTEQYNNFKYLFRMRGLTYSMINIRKLI